MNQDPSPLSSVRTVEPRGKNFLHQPNIDPTPRRRFQSRFVNVAFADCGNNETFGTIGYRTTGTRALRN